MSDLPNVPFQHVLQQAGLLRSFQVAKLVSHKDVTSLKKLIKSIAKDKTEYKAMLEEEMQKLKSSTITSVPGIVFFDDPKRLNSLVIGGKIYAKKIKAMNLTKNQTCFLLMTIINSLGLKQSDFESLEDFQSFGADESDGNEETA